MPLTPLPNNNSSTSAPPSSSASGPTLQRSSTIGMNTIIMNATTGPYGSASTSALNVGRNLSTASSTVPSRKASQPPVTTNTMISLGVAPSSLLMGTNSSSVMTTNYNNNNNQNNNNNHISNNISTTNGTPSSSSSTTSHTSKEYEQVNQVFDGLSMSIHQLYHQLKQTQDSIRKISETQQLQLDPNLSTTTAHSQRFLDRYGQEDQQKQDSLTLEEVTNDQVLVNASATRSASPVTSSSLPSSSTKDTTFSTTFNNSTGVAKTTAIIERPSFLKNVPSDISSSLNDTSIFSELQLELTLKNEENATLKLRIEELLHQIETLQKRVSSSTYVIEPVSKPVASQTNDEESIEFLKEQLATQKEINRIQSVKVANYESAIKLILSRSHDKMEELKRENNTMTELMKKENQTLQALNSKLLNQNIILKSRLLEVMEVLRDAARQRDLELVKNESVLESYMKERELLLSLLKISEETETTTP
ncbi:hypothetical protein FDP41_006023 [Naegleria fowleri]|uniref:Uncharacterized protein n=1 Tax=Naegleria fowleri TaxID=5763 RepID=A0A6A5BLP0_NAEFO|nr:uncharacterized protein FDP41_006023 [Naegleria fowleri]KAF0975271.1 hypothetical protein FDP41_006023 [Naegleria fowleri]